MKPTNVPLIRMTFVMAASGLGITILKIALPVLAGTYGTSSMDVSLVAGAMSIAWPVFSLISGWGLDRYGRITVYRAGLAAIVLAATAYLAAVGTFDQSILLLCLVGLLVGVGEVLTETSGQTVLPDLIADTQLHRGNSFLQGARTVSATLLAPLLIAIFLDTSPLALFILAVLVTLVCFPALPNPARLTTSPDKGFRGFFVGATALWQLSDLRILTCLLMLMSVSWGAWMTLIVSYSLSSEHLGLGVNGVGLIMTVLGCGSLTGAMLYPKLRANLGDLRMRALDPLATVLFILMPALGCGFWPVLTAAFLAGAGGVTWSISLAAYQQTSIPKTTLGRTVAAYRWIGWTGFFVGASASGPCADLIGLQSAFMVFLVPAASAVVLYFLAAPRGSGQERDDVSQGSNAC